MKNFAFTIAILALSLVPSLGIAQAQEETTEETFEPKHVFGVNVDYLFYQSKARGFGIGLTYDGAVTKHFFIGPIIHAGYGKHTSKYIDNYGGWNFGVDLALSLRYDREKFYIHPKLFVGYGLATETCLEKRESGLGDNVSQVTFSRVHNNALELGGRLEAGFKFQSCMIGVYVGYTHHIFKLHEKETIPQLGIIRLYYPIQNAISAGMSFSYYLK